MPSDLPPSVKSSAVGACLSVSVCLLLTSCTARPEKDAESNWQSDYQSAKLALFSNELSAAETGFKKVLVAMPADNSDSSVTPIDVRARLAITYARQGRLSESIPDAEAVLDYVARNKLSDFQSEILVLMDDLSEIYLYESKKESKDYARLLQLSIRLEEASHTGNHGRLVTTLAKLAIYNIESGDIEDARAYCKRAIEIVTGPSKSNFTKNTIVLMGVSIAFKRKNLDEDAREVFDAVKNCYKNLGDFAEAIAIDRLGTAYMEDGSFREALDCFDKVIKIRGQSKDDPTGYSLVLMRSALCHESLGEFATADKQFGQSVEMQRLAPGQNKKHLHERLNEYSAYLMRRKQPGKSEKFKKEAHDLIRDLIPE